MSEPNWDNWNAWAKAHVAEGVEQMVEVVGEEFGELERTLTERLAKLESEVGELRAALAVYAAAAQGSGEIDDNTDDIIVGS